MNVSEMINELGARLEDADENQFTASFKLLQLNNAQRKLAHLLVDEYLTELEVFETLTASATGLIGMDGSGTEGTDTSTATPHKVLRGAEGILKVASNVSGLFATRLPIRDLKKKENTYYAASAANPLYYVFENNIYVKPAAATKWDIYYQKVPTSLLCSFGIASIAADTITADGDQGLEETADYYNNAVIYCPTAGRYFIITADDGSLGFTVTPNPAAVSADETEPIVTASDTFYFLTHDFDQTSLDSVTCDLNPSLHELVVSFAEAGCWKMGNKLDRAKATLEMSLMEVAALNDRYKVESGMGIGSRNRE